MILLTNITANSSACLHFNFFYRILYAKEILSLHKYSNNRPGLTLYQLHNGTHPILQPLLKKDVKKTVKTQGKRTVEKNGMILIYLETQTAQNNKGINKININFKNADSITREC